MNRRQNIQKVSHFKNWERKSVFKNKCNQHLHKKNYNIVKQNKRCFHSIHNNFVFDGKLLA